MSIKNLVCSIIFIIVPFIQVQAITNVHLQIKTIICCENKQGKANWFTPVSNDCPPNLGVTPSNQCTLSEFPNVNLSEGRLSLKQSQKFALRCCHSQKQGLHFAKKCSENATPAQGCTFKRAKVNFFIRNQ